METNGSSLDACQKNAGMTLVLSTNYLTFTSMTKRGKGFCFNIAIKKSRGGFKTLPYIDFENDK
jgi:hypothetical protein